MGQRFERRLRLLENRLSPRGAHYVVRLPHGVHHGDEDYDRICTKAIAGHQEAIGYMGQVMIAPEPCATVEEWQRKYAPNV